MTERHQRIQALYEIALSIGPKESLEETADSGLEGYLRKLNCSVGAVLHEEGGEYETVTTIPETAATSELLTAAIERAKTLAEDEGLPITEEPTAGSCFHLLSLPDFGLLVLGKQGGEIEPATLTALSSLNEKLAEACQSKLVERQLRKERTRMEAVFDAIPEPLANTVVSDGTERIIASNDQFDATFGDPETHGREIATLTDHSQRRPVETVGRDQQITTETTCQTKAGPREFLFHSVPVTGAHTAEYIQLYVDITEQKQREQELQRYERLVENLPIGVYRTTPGPDGEFRLVNQGLVEIFGADSKAYFADRPVSDIYVNPDKRAEFSARLLDERAVDGVEIQFETAAGNQIWGTVSGIVTEDEGETVFELALQDITARKERDQQLNVLNRVLRHNLRNAINVIEGNTELLADAVEGEQLQSCVSGIDQRVSNLKQLSEKAVKVRSVFEHGRSISTVCNVQALLMRVGREFEESHPDARVVVDSVDELTVVADFRLKLALSDLVTNAVVHNDQPNPEVRLTAGPSSSKPSDEWVDIVVSDDGPGIPVTERKAIETGEETPLQHGTGLGLWLVYWAISLLGGEISIADNTAGTQITLTLPRTRHNTDCIDSDTAVVTQNGNS